METQGNVKSTAATRRLGRLAAVQGLYQMALGGEGAVLLIRRFQADPSVLLQEEQSVLAVDAELFGQIVTGVETHQEALDALIAGSADERLSPQRMEPLLKAILRAGAFELLHVPASPTGALISDYVDVAHGFFGSKEPGLVNAILDKIARSVRDRV